MKNNHKEGRKREERLGELRSMENHKQGLTAWRGGRGRSGLVSLEMWHDTNEDSPTGGEEEGGVDWSLLESLETWHIKMRTHQLEGRKRKEEVGELRNVTCHKQRRTNLRGEMGRNIVENAQIR